MKTYIGTATSRVDGRAKVTGAAKYAGEFITAGLAHASVVTSTIAKGRIARIDASEALSRRRRDRRAHAPEPAAHGERRQRLQGRCGSGRVAVPAALRRPDLVQRPAGRTGGRRRAGDRALRGVAGPRGIRRGSARHGSASPARRGRRIGAGREPVRPAKAARYGRAGIRRSRGPPPRPNITSRSSITTRWSSLPRR